MLRTGFLPAPIAPSQLAARLLAQQKYERIQVSHWCVCVTAVHTYCGPNLQEEGGDVQEIEMEVEEEGDAEKEEAKARKKVSIV